MRLVYSGEDYFDGNRLRTGVKIHDQEFVCNAGVPSCLVRYVGCVSICTFGVGVLAKLSA